MDEDQDPVSESMSNKGSTTEKVTQWHSSNPETRAQISDDDEEDSSATTYQSYDYADSVTGSPMKKILIGHSKGAVPPIPVSSQPESSRKSEPEPQRVIIDDSSDDELEKEVQEHGPEREKEPDDVDVVRDEKLAKAVQDLHLKSNPYEDHDYIVSPKTIRNKDRQLYPLIGGILPEDLQINQSSNEPLAIGAGHQLSQKHTYLVTGNMYPMSPPNVSSTTGTVRSRSVSASSFGGSPSKVGTFSTPGELRQTVGQAQGHLRYAPVASADKSNVNRHLGQPTAVHRPSLSLQNRGYQPSAQNYSQGEIAQPAPTPPHRQVQVGNKISANPFRGAPLVVPARAKILPRGITPRGRRETQTQPNNETLSTTQGQGSGIGDVKCVPETQPKHLTSSGNIDHPVSVPFRHSSGSGDGDVTTLVSRPAPRQIQSPPAPPHRLRAVTAAKEVNTPPRKEPVIHPAKSFAGHVSSAIDQMPENLIEEPFNASMAAATSIPNVRLDDQSETAITRPFGSPTRSAVDGSHELRYPGSQQLYQPRRSDAPVTVEKPRGRGRPPRSSTSGSEDPRGSVLTNVAIQRNYLPKSAEFLSGSGINKSEQKKAESSVRGRGRPPKHKEEYSEDDYENDDGEIEEDNDEWTFRCFCGLNKLSDTGLMIQCEQCEVWQHSECFGISKSIASNDSFSYRCEICDPTKRLPFTKEQARKIIREIERKERKMKEDDLRHQSNGRNVPLRVRRNSENRRQKPEAVQTTCSKRVHGLLRQRENIPGDEMFSLRDPREVPLAKELVVCPGNEGTGLVAKLDEGIDGKKIEKIRKGTVIIEIFGHICMPDECSKSERDGRGRQYRISYDGLVDDKGQMDALLIIDSKLSKYDSPGRYVRRSCRPNAVLRHIISKDKSNIHIVIVANEDLTHSDEITIPFDSDFIWTNTYNVDDCACRLAFSGKCLLQAGFKGPGHRVCDNVLPQPKEISAEAQCEASPTATKEEKSEEEIASPVEEEPSVMTKQQRSRRGKSRAVSLKTQSKSKDVGTASQEREAEISKTNAASNTKPRKKSIIEVEKLVAAQENIRFLTHSDPGKTRKSRDERFLEAQLKMIQAQDESEKIKDKEESDSPAEVKQQQQPRDRKPRRGLSVVPGSSAVVNVSRKRGKTITHGLVRKDNAASVSKKPGSKRSLAGKVGKSASMISSKEISVSMISSKEILRNVIRCLQTDAVKDFSLGAQSFKACGRNVPVYTPPPSTSNAFTTSSPKRSEDNPSVPTLALEEYRKRRNGLSTAKSAPPPKKSFIPSLSSNMDQELQPIRFEDSPSMAASKTEKQQSSDPDPHNISVADRMKLIFKLDGN